MVLVTSTTSLVTRGSNLIGDKTEIDGYLGVINAYLMLQQIVFHHLFQAHDMHGKLDYKEWGIKRSNS